ncbi:Uncharacterised protein [Yersinia frederiksenii]|uniref:hypothetical protein n=1 Tax=Yersinia frederiksenii TaxID=29484 RepID=UPI0005E37496|nr:hypothetical protein [Yersinia frederiksenii]MDN0120474.1 hypothetical protein [Yersinia frederiksenii]CFR00590.1 Uncharacterised protein [Yersinia frederiksenii]
MRRIDIEGALPPLGERYFKESQPQYLGNEKQKQQFARYLTTHSSVMPEAAGTSTRGDSLMQTEYRLVSGPLRGAKIHVSLTANGLHIVLSHTRRELIDRLQRIQTRWQRQLHQLGFPCLLEVTHVGDVIG